MRNAMGLHEKNISSPCFMNNFKNGMPMKKEK